MSPPAAAALALAAGADAEAAPPPVLAAGDDVAPDGVQAAIRLGAAARPATPAIPPRTRRRVIGVEAALDFSGRGVTESAMFVLLQAVPIATRRERTTNRRSS